MATPIEDITFLARTARGLKGVSGGDITLPSSTTAEGLDKAGNITIDAHAGTDTNVDVTNTGAGGVTLRVFGDVAASAILTDDLTVSNGIAFKDDPGVSKGVIDGTFSATRTFNFPNFDGNVVVTSTTNVNAGRIMVSGNVHLQDNGSTKAIQLTGAPTSNRAVTFPDASGTVVLQDGSGNATVSHWIVCDTPFMRGATGTDNMRFNCSGVSGSRAVTIPSKSGTMAVGTPAAAIADLVVGVATVDDCAAAINRILAVLRGFEQVSP